VPITPALLDELNTLAGEIGIAPLLRVHS